MAGKIKPAYLSVGPQPTETIIPLDNSITEPTQKKDLNFNPIFNFDQSFVNSLQDISAVELGSSVPYVSLRLVDFDGSIINDISMNFLHKPVELDKISTKERFGERPLMSLKDIEIKTNLAAGYLYYTEVTLRIKIHSPSLLTNSTLMFFLIPSFPLQLEYGWNSPNDFLNETKEKLLFQVKTYTLTMDTTGQVDLTVEGLALNETFNNIYIGDTGQKIETELTDGKQFAGISRSLEKLNSFMSVIKDVQKQQKEGMNDYDKIKELADGVQDTEKNVRGILSEEFAGLKSELANVVDVYSFGKKKDHKINVIRFHDLVKTMCDGTFAAMGEMFPGISDFTVTYGNFNEKAGGFANKSIAEFPINKEKFDKLLKGKNKNGERVMTVKNFLDLITNEFMENGSYWTSLLTATQKEEFKMPDVAINFTNRRGNTVDLQIVDVNSGIPPTTSLFPSGVASSSLLEDEIRKNNIPIVRLGHANSFIKNISLSQISDQYMKAAFIERMHRDRIESVRSSLLSRDSLETSGTNPITLPLRGTATVLGHTGWKPFRAFYLSTGINIVDAIYKITGVTHKLSSEGFETSIDFMYH